MSYLINLDSFRNRASAVESTVDSPKSAPHNRSVWYIFQKILGRFLDDNETLSFSDRIYFEAITIITIMADQYHVPAQVASKGN